MSALETGLIAQLPRTPWTPHERALRRIVSLYTGNSMMTGHELRVLKIALEGLGVPSWKRRQAVQAAIQLKRDRVMAERATPHGGTDESA
ncbi:hypothetical protein ASF61_06620 [Duganella sp. Leaf126]|uniref:hypothetical protein n=1 Tax=Duganella sp. Leaf126 TaxID=1736266 RepID=UPI0006FD0428|nr:hypothetical protein [Duganella sp. Leaf126]KQQ40421.1 hypothetical protein ASF61_06620 [Duganella sp. Leaf126]